MAEVTGPISTLPGARHSFPEGTMCDMHPDRPAVARVQGETDSFGCEMLDMCTECLAEHRAEVRAADTSGTCEWCKSHADKRFNARDYEEGTAGRVYQVCQKCIDRQGQQLADELSGYDDF